MSAPDTRRIIASKNRTSTYVTVQNLGASSDDTYQFVPSPPAILVPKVVDGMVVVVDGVVVMERAPTNYGNLDIRRGQYVNCIGYSSNARLMVVASDDRDAAGYMRSRISDCSFIGVRGRAALRSIVLEIEDSDGDIEHINFTDCAVESVGNIERANEILLQISDMSGPHTGTIRDIRFQGLTVITPFKRVIDMISATMPTPMNRIESIYLDGFFFDAPRLPVSSIMNLNSTTEAIVKNGVLRCNGGSGIVVGIGMYVGRNVSIENITIYDIPEGFSGIDLDAAPNASIRHSRFVQATGATSALAVNLQDTSSGCTIEDNDFTGVTGTVVTYNAGAPENIVQRNRGLPDAAVVVASAASLVYQSRWNVWRITGTATINTIAPPPSGSALPITLLFDAACAVNELGNIWLSDAFTSVQHASLTLRWSSNAIRWIETGRSPRGASPVTATRFAAGAGTAANPAIARSGSGAGTGLWFPAPTVLARSTAGVERSRLLATGEEVHGHTNRVNVGGALTGRLQAYGAGHEGSVNLGSFSADQTGPSLRLGKSRGPLVNGFGVVVNDDRLGEVVFCGADGTNLASVGAFIRALADGTPGSSSIPARLELGLTNHGTTAPVTRLTLTPDGRLFGSALHNNPGSVSGATEQFIASGIYAPTLTSVANISGETTAVACQWMRVGNVVTVSGSARLQPAVNMTSTILGISLPIPSALTGRGQCAGTATWPDVAGQSAAVVGDAVFGRALVEFISTNISLRFMYFTFTYVIRDAVP